MSYYVTLKTKSNLFVYFLKLFLPSKIDQKMTQEDRMEIVRDNRVARLLWFTIGFFCATIITYWVMKNNI